MENVKTVPEFRVYYDDQGKILFYTCEKPEGKYLVIDSITFIQARPDLRVIDGKLTKLISKGIISKLKPSETGKKCAKEDVSIPVNESYTGESLFWELETYEIK